MVKTYSKENSNNYTMKAKSSLYFVEVSNGIYQVTKDDFENYLGVGAIVASQAVVTAFNECTGVTIERLDGNFVSNVDFNEK